MIPFVGTSQVTYSNVNIDSKELSEDSLLNLLRSNRQHEITLSTINDKKALDGRHQTFQIHVGGYPVHNHRIYLHTLAAGKYKVRFPKTDFDAIGASVTPLNKPKANHASGLMNTLWYHQIEWVKMEDKWVLAEVAKGTYQNDMAELIIDATGNIINNNSLTVYNGDSTGVGRAFNPDPITLSNSEYGDVLVDNNDQATPQFDLYYSLQSFPIQRQSSAWVLASDFSIAIDSLMPLTGVPNSINGRFDFDRSENGFEYVNTHFHISQLRTYLSSLGYDNLSNYQIRFDAHASEFDQSFFQPLSFERGWLGFGDGGVDDAEDADVIIHEYGHAISYSAAPATNLGPEREALDEAFCDYLAYSYSKDISENQSNRVFNWDGHNEFWSGRITDDIRTYPSDLENDIYLDASLFTSAMAEIHHALGREVTDKLFITSLYSYFIDMRMTDAAELIVQSDSLLYQNEHQSIIENIFCLRGLLQGCEDTLVNDKPLIQPYLGNTQEFAQNNSILYLYPNSNVLTAWNIYDISGNLVGGELLETGELPFYIIDIQSLTAGIYILSVETDSEDFSFKIIKY